MLQPKPEIQVLQMLKEFDQLTAPDTGPSWEDELEAKLARTPASNYLKNPGLKYSVIICLLVLFNVFLFVKISAPHKQLQEKRNEVLLDISSALLINSNVIP